MIKEIAQNCAKTKRPTKKMNKSNFEVHGLTSILHLLTLMGVLRKGPQFSGQNCQNLHFLKVLKKRKMANFKSKNLCDESSKIPKTQILSKLAVKLRALPQHPYQS